MAIGRVKLGALLLFLRLVHFLGLLGLDFLNQPIIKSKKGMPFFTSKKRWPFSHLVLLASTKLFTCMKGIDWVGGVSRVPL